MFTGTRQSVVFQEEGGEKNQEFCILQLMVSFCIPVMDW